MAAAVSDVFDAATQAEIDRAWDDPPHTHNWAGHTNGVRVVVHRHPWGWLRHSHMLRAICLKPECVGFPTHDIHPRRTTD